ncbi:MAG: GNAT family N-acetyltransferase [Marinicella sp.]
MYEIKIDNLSSSKVTKLLAEHQDRMADNSPPESRHVLDVTALKRPEITFWAMWNADKLMGCVALKHWNDSLGELKSMKTAPAFIRRGVGQRLLEHVIAVAQQRGYRTLKLETGSMSYFAPARNLYRKHGFQPCEPFGDYVHDPNSVYMQLDIQR